MDCCVVFGDPDTVKTILPKARIRARIRAFLALGDESKL